MSELVMGKWGGKPQLRKPRKNAFTPRKRQKFLDALALTCNVAAAAAYAGVEKTTPYYTRAHDPEFVEQWRAAIEAGYDRLETLVLEHGGAGHALEPADPDRAEGEGAPPPFDFDRALHVLRLYRAKREGVAVPRGGRERRNATREETNAALRKGLAAARKRLARARGDDV